MILYYVVDDCLITEYIIKLYGLVQEQKIDWKQKLREY